MKTISLEHLSFVCVCVQKFSGFCCCCWRFVGCILASFQHFFFRRS